MLLKLTFNVAVGDCCAVRVDVNLWLRRFLRRTTYDLLCLAMRESG